MSREIDERVVDMRFDNHDFENRVDSTLKSLNKLNAGLDMTESAKGFGNLSLAIGSFNMNPLITAAEAVGNKFSAMEIVAITALQNITNSAINTGKRLLESVTIEQISQGWGKYDTQTKSIGTLVSQGNRLEDVTAEMNRLAVFTDETSYSMTQMTENIAKFTATGKSLNDSVSAMEGISLWAASAGQNASVANRAMYQLSQALGAGVMRKEDYRSIQNASMDTDEFRQICLDTAVALGTLRKNADDTYTSLANKNAVAFSKAQFSEHLTEDRWFTDDVMLEVYKKYANGWDKIAEYAEEQGITVTDSIRHIEEHMSDFDISEWELKVVKAGQEARSWGDAIDSVREAVSTGWTKTFELIFGNYDEATKLWTDLSVAMYDVFAEPGNARNDLLKESMMSGWNQLIQTGIKNSDAYKNKIIDVAREHGIAIDEMIESTGSFEESLKEGWAQSDIFAEAMQRLTDETSNLSEEQLKEMGLTQKQVESFQKINEKIKDGSIVLDDYVEKMGQMSGRENLIQAFWDVWEAVGDILGTVKRAFEEVFPPATADTIYTITENVRDMAASFKSAVENMLGFNHPIFQLIAGNAEKAGVEIDALDRVTKVAGSDFTNTFRGLFALFDIVGQAIGAVLGGVKELISPLKSLGSAALGVTGDFGSWLYALDQNIREQGIFTNAVQNFVGFIKSIPPAIDGVVQKLSGLTISEMIELLRTRIDSLWSSIKKFVSGFTSSAETVVATDDTLVKSVGPLEMLLGGLKDLFLGFVDVIRGFIPTFSELAEVIGTAFSKIGKSVSEMFQNGDINKLFELIKNGAFASISVGISKLVNNLSDSSEALEKLGSFSGIKEIFKTLIGGLSEAEGSSGLFSSFSKIKEVFDGFKDTLEEYQNTLKTESLMKIATAIAILAASMVVLASIDSDKLGGVSIAMTAMFAELTYAMKYLADETSGVKKIGKFMAIGRAMLMISASIAIMALALKSISKLEPEQIIMGITAIGVMLTELSLFLTKTDLDGLSRKKGAGILLAAIAIDVLATAVKKLSDLDLAGLAKGLGGVGLVLTELSLFLNKTDFKGFGITKGAGLLLVAASISLIALAVKQLGGMDLMSIATGLGALSVILLALGLFINAVGGTSGGKMLLVGVGLVMMSNAILVLAGALTIMSSIDIMGMLVAIGGLGLVLLELGIAMNAMKTSIGGAAALTVAAIAITILASALKSLAQLKLSEVGIALLALAGALAVIGIAANLMIPLIPAMMGFAGAVALLGAGMLACALAAQIFAVSLGTLAVTGSAGIGVLVAAFAGAISLIPLFFQAVSQGVITMISTLTENIPVLIEGAKTIIITLCSAIIECLPILMETLGVLLTAVVQLLTEHLPIIVDGAIAIVIAILDGVAAKIPEIIDSAINLIVSFIEGLAKGISENTDRIIEAVTSLCFAIIDAFLKFFGISGADSRKMWEEAKKIVAGIINGIGTKVRDAVHAMNELGHKMVEAIRGFKTKLKNTAKSIIAGFIQGIKDKLKDVAESAMDIGNTLLGKVKGVLGIASPSKEMAKLGAYSTEGFANGLIKHLRPVTTAATRLKETTVKSFRRAFSEVGTEIGRVADELPVIRPVFDLSSVSDGVHSLSSMIDTKKAYELAWKANGSFGDGIFNQNAIISDTVSRLNGKMTDMETAVNRLSNAVNGGLTGTIAGAVRESLNGVGVSMNHRAVGQIITDYQDGMRMRGGR